MTTTPSHIDERLYGAFSNDNVLTIQRRLPGPLTRVWAYLTDSDLRAQWLASGEMEQRTGSSFELVWRNDDLSASPSERPAGFPEVSRATCQITEIDPPRMLRFTWPNVGEVTVRLEAVGDDEVLLTLTHRGCPEGVMRVMVAAGWHAHLDILVARCRGEEPGAFWVSWMGLRDLYERRIAG